MELIINVKILEKSELSLEEFVLLHLIDFELEGVDRELISPLWMELEKGLQEQMYIKIIDDQCFPRQKALNLFGITNSTGFIDFWEKYHKVTGMPKTDKTPAEKYWKRLTKKQKQRAYDMIEPYYNSLKDVRYCKKARTYLGDRNFEDEYVHETASSSDPFIQKT